MKSGLPYIAALALASFILPQAAGAQGVAEFYRGKTIDILVPSVPGGDYDLRGRLISRHMGRLIPGNPSMVVKNIPGGIGVAAANQLALVSPRDGTVLHMIFQNMPVLQAIGAKGVQFDVLQFGWLGNTTNSPNVINSWHTTGITKIEDVLTRELAVGAPGVSSTSYIYPAALNAAIGTKFKIVTGYGGGAQVDLAMERGEVGGRGSNSWASWKAGHPHWLRDKQIHILVQIGLTRARDLPDVPMMYELAKNDEDREFLKFLSSDMGISRALVTTPGVPAERRAAVRKAFMDTMKDPEFLSDAAKTQRDIEPSTGEEAQEIARSMMAVSPKVLARVKELLDPVSK